MDGQLLQLGGSLVAILVLAALAWALKLGPSPKIADEADARRLANEADTGFGPSEVAVSVDGASAILADSRGRIMVLRKHGTHFAARVLEPGAGATAADGVLTVTPTDRTFGKVELDLGDAAKTWESRLDALKEARNA